MGIAGFGFLFANLPPKNDQAAAAFLRSLKGNLPLLLAGIVCLGLATGAALAHRFFSTDYLTHQVTILRLLRRGTNKDYDESDQAENSRLLKKERAAQHADLWRCRILVVTAAGLLFVGVALAVTAFALAVSVF